MNPKKSKPTDAQHTIAFVLQGGGALGAYRHKGGESQTKDAKFSRATMLAHGQAGRADMTHSLHSLAGAPADTHPASFRVFDYHPRSTERAAR